MAVLGTEEVSEWCIRCEGAVALKLSLVRPGGESESTAVFDWPDHGTPSVSPYATHTVILKCVSLFSLQ